MYYLKISNIDIILFEYFAPYYNSKIPESAYFMNTEKPKLLSFGKKIDGSIRIPGSKSLSNRALIIAALAKGESVLEGFLHSDDTSHMIAALRKLGVAIHVENQQVTVAGCHGEFSPCEESLYIENAGTAARFLTAALTLGKGTYIVDGNARMQQRPIGDLMNAINTLGGTVKDLKDSLCPPIQITATELKGGTVELDGTKSSQYLSALMMVLPLVKNPSKIKIKGALVSKTYVEMTKDMMADFGVQCSWPHESEIFISGKQEYLARSYQIEGDASSASYFFAGAAVTQGSIRVYGLQEDSTQGDLKLLQLLEKMGCKATWHSDYVLLEGFALHGIDVDMNTMSDVAPTLAIVALFAKGKTTIRNVANMRIKECDRIAAMCTEMRKLGAEVEEWEDGFSIEGLQDYKGVQIQTYQDHRIAMSFAVAALKIPDLAISNPLCVSKTYPNFFQDFESLLVETP